MRRYFLMILLIPFLIGAGFDSYDEKTTPADTDIFLILDKTNGGTKKVKIGNLPDSGNGTGINWSSYSDLNSLSNAQEFLVNDSGTSKSVNWETVSGYFPTESGWITDGTNTHTTTENDNVGIGTITPNARLEIVGTLDPLMVSSTSSGSGNYFKVLSGGNIGINTTNPGQKLDISGNARMKGNSALYFGDNSQFIVASTTTNGNMDFYTNSSSRRLAIKNDGSVVINDDSNNGLNAFRVEGDSDQYMIVTYGTNNSVGIGTFAATSKLYVSQTASADSFRVDDVAADTTPFVINQSGNVGIGLATPSAKLEVVGTLVVSSSTSSVTKKSAANTACNTTCGGTFCLHGQESTSKDDLDCSDATADVCFCLGP